MINAQKVRRDFPILKRKINGKQLVYLDSAATSQKPKQVIGAVVDFYQNHNANVARGVHKLAEESTQMYESAREKVAEFIGASAEEVVFVRNSTEALNLVAFSWGLMNLKKGDVIVTSVLEHHSNLLPWRMVVERMGAKIRYVDVDEEGKIVLSREASGKRTTPIRSPVPLGSLSDLLDERVKIVALSAKSNMTGAFQPIDKAFKMVRKVSKQALFVVDGSHSVPHLPTDVKKLGGDFLTFSGHKMLGPMGVGVLWGKRRHLEAMQPFLRGGDMISEVTLGGEKWNRVPHKFEAGTPNVAGAVGLAAAVEYLDNIGMEDIYQHEVELTEYALEKFQAPNSKFQLSLIGPKQAEPRAGVVTFNVEGVHAHDVAQILSENGVMVRSGHHCTGPLMERFGITASVRASFYLYNTKEDIDRLVEALKKVPKVFRL
jgi:cysteine desulfurase/selenocysteine lyase